MNGARTTAPNCAKGWIKRADSIPALAALLGLDPAALADTVRRWNRACDAGHDAEFGRTLMLEPIAGGPFYAVELSPSMLNTQGGPRRNEQGADRRPGRHADPAPLQRRRTRLDLQLSLSGHRQYRRMPRLRPHRRPQRGGRDGVGVEKKVEHSPSRPQGERASARSAGRVRPDRTARFRPLRPSPPVGVSGLG